MLFFFGWSLLFLRIDQSVTKGLNSQQVLEVDIWQDLFRLAPHLHHFDFALDALLLLLFDRFQFGKGIHVQLLPLFIKFSADLFLSKEQCPQALYAELLQLLTGRFQFGRVWIAQPLDNHVVCALAIQQDAVLVLQHHGHALTVAIEFDDVQLFEVYYASTVLNDMLIVLVEPEVLHTAKPRKVDEGKLVW